MGRGNFRIERDSMGPVKVPASAYWGACTQRAVQNFPISGYRLPRRFLWALGLIKEGAAAVNKGLRRLPADLAVAIEQASREVAAGKFDRHFVVDVFQTGSGTSTNMNANEVIARRAEELLRKSRRVRVHPNDHVNLGQSSNDVIPSALHIAAAKEVWGALVPALEELEAALSAKGREFDGIVKVGRTHLQDATPVRLGQEFGGWARQVELACERVKFAAKGLAELAIGGTAVGTGIATHPEFGARVASWLSQRTGLELREALDHFEAQGARDAAVALGGALKGLGVTLTKIARDLALLSSGPRCGLGEIVLPALQPGSSIMPGKVNPVMTEVLTQVAAFLVGVDATVGFAGQCGFLELNTAVPVIAYQLLEGMRIASAAARAFTRSCVAGIRADGARCRELVEKSLGLATALLPVIGYDRAGELAKRAYRSGRSVGEEARELGIRPSRELARLLDPETMTRPQDFGARSTRRAVKKREAR